MLAVALRFLYSIYCIITFIIGFLLLFPLFILFSFFGSKGEKANWLLVKIWSKWWFMMMCIYGKKQGLAYIDKHKQYIIVANHISYLDTAMIFHAIPFYAKTLAKSELGKIPLFGFLYKQLAIMVSRDSDESRQHSIKEMLKHIRLGGSIFIFPEGSFNQSGYPLKSFYDGAFKIALETHTSILPVLFLDTNKRMNNSGVFTFSPGRSRTVFLPEINSDTFNQYTIQTLKDTVWNTMNKSLVQYQ